jgi:hypothetical protein
VGVDLDVSVAPLLVIRDGGRSCIRNVGPFSCMKISLIFIRHRCQRTIASRMAEIICTLARLYAGIRESLTLRSLITHTYEGVGTPVPRLIWIQDKIGTPRINAVLTWKQHGWKVHGMGYAP